MLIHANAWLRDKTIAVAALAGGGSDEGVVTGGSGELWQDTVVDETGTTLEELRGGGPRPSTGAAARRTGAKLPPWYDRTRARRHVVGALEDDAGRLMMMQWRIAGKEGMFQQKKAVKPVEKYQELDFYRAVKKIGGALSGVARGSSRHW